MMNNETKWTIDQAHSEISFKVRHLMISYVKGYFKVFSADIHTIDKDFTTADIDLWIDAASISTGDTKRDDHLRGPEFFDVKKHKYITFKAHSMEKGGKNTPFELWGDLNIKGITKKIKLNVEFGGIMKDPYGNEKAGFALSGKINRNDWGLHWNAPLEAGGILLSDEVLITCEVELQSVESHEPVSNRESVGMK